MNIIHILPIYYRLQRSTKRLYDLFLETENLDWTFIDIYNFTLIDYRWIRIRNKPQAVRRASPLELISALGSYYPRYRSLWLRKFKGVLV